MPYINVMSWNLERVTLSLVSQTHNVASSSKTSQYSIHFGKSLKLQRLFANDFPSFLTKQGTTGNTKRPFWLTIILSATAIISD